jgi:hypothetical protein
MSQITTQALNRPSREKADLPCSICATTSSGTTSRYRSNAPVIFAGGLSALSPCAPSRFPHVCLSSLWIEQDGRFLIPHHDRMLKHMLTFLFW